MSHEWLCHKWQMGNFTKSLFSSVMDWHSYIARKILNFNSPHVWFHFSTVETISIPNNFNLAHFHSRLFNLLNHKLFNNEVRGGVEAWGRSLGLKCLATTLVRLFQLDWRMERFMVDTFSVKEFMVESEMFWVEKHRLENRCLFPTFMYLHWNLRFHSSL